MTAPLIPSAQDPRHSPYTRREVLLLHTRQQQERRVLVRAGGIAAMGLVLALGIALFFGDARQAVSDEGSRPGGAVGRMTLPAAVSDSPVIYDTAVMPLAPEEASAINAKRPVDVAKVIPARALRIASESAAGVGYAAGLRCLTQAIYYEAASEQTDGQRAVAQVVLNRVRHPAFPNTICGVVYQGSDRITGCQFSFTCDGSLARIPSVGGWARAERLAKEAMAGTVARAVGNATHYHANYVVPYWAPTLDKVATIGAHIFYIMRGFLGSPRAFSARYDVALEAPAEGGMLAPGLPTSEQAGSLDPLAVPAALAPKFEMPAEDSRSGSLIVGGSNPGMSLQAAPALRADEQRGELNPGGGGTLKADEAKAPSGPATPAARTAEE